jgi:TRAP-type C4-dicarboxylate transport system permease small subunit
MPASDSEKNMSAAVLDDAVADALRKSGDVPSGAEGLRLHPVESIVLGGLLLIVTSLLVLQMVGRFAGSSAFGWSEEGARYAFIWVVFLGAGVAVRTRNHIMADVLRPSSDGRLALAWLAFLELIVALTAACLLKYGIDFVRVTSNMVMVSLGVSMAYVAAAVPVGAAVMLVWSIANIGRLVRQITSRADRHG